MNNDAIIRKNLRSVGTMVACARLLRGETEDAVGKAVGLCAATVSKIEQGQYRNLTYRKLVKLCRYLEIPVKEG